MVKLDDSEDEVKPAVLVIIRLLSFSIEPAWKANLGDYLGDSVTLVFVGLSVEHPENDTTMKHEV